MLPFRHAVAQLLGNFPLGPVGMRNDPSLLNLQFNFTHIITHDPIEPSANRFQSSCASLSPAGSSTGSTFCTFTGLAGGATRPPRGEGHAGRCLTEQLQVLFSCFIALENHKCPEMESSNKWWY